MSSILGALKSVYSRYFGSDPQPAGPQSPKEAVERMVDRLEPSQVVEVLKKSGLDPQKVKIEKSFVQLNSAINQKADLIIVRILENPSENDLKELLESLALNDLEKRDLHKRARHKDRRIRDGAEKELSQHVRKCCRENNIDKLHALGKIFARYDKDVQAAFVEVENNLEEAKDSIKLLCLADLFNKVEPSPHFGSVLATSPDGTKRFIYEEEDKRNQEQPEPLAEEKQKETIFEALARICSEVADEARQEKQEERQLKEAHEHEELAEEKGEVNELARLHPEMRDEILRKYMPGFMKSALFSALTDTQQMEIESQCAERKEKESSKDA